jgi:hypothetical protein
MRKFIFASLFVVFASTPAHASVLEQICLRQIDMNGVGDRGPIEPKDMNEVEAEFMVSKEFNRLKSEMGKCLGELRISRPLSVIAPSEMRDGGPSAFIQVVIGGEKEACVVRVESYFTRKLKEMTGKITLENSERVTTYVYQPLICNFADREEREI